jgi:hypothetical protein
VRWSFLFKTRLIGYVRVSDPKNSRWPPHKSTLFVWDLRDFALAAPTPTHGGSEVCQSVGRRMPVWLRPSAGEAAPLPCCIHALTCTHAPTRAYTSCPACSSAPLVVRLLHCQSRSSLAIPRRLSHPRCCVTPILILCAPANGRNSFEWALLQYFRALRAPSG